MTDGVRHAAVDRCKATCSSDPPAGAVQVLFMGDAEFGKYAPIDSPGFARAPRSVIIFPLRECP